MLALPQKSEWPGGAGHFAEQIKTQSLNSATDVARWKYSAFEMLGRFLVLSPAGLAVEDCVSAAAADRLAASWNARTGLGVR